MDIFVSYDAYIESKRLLDTLALLSQGFYIQHGFYVLPELKSDHKLKPVVILPRLQYYQYENGWKSFEYQNNPNDLYDVNENYIERLKDQLIKGKYFKKMTKEQLFRFENEIQAVLKPVLPQLPLLFPYIKNREIHFHIHPTHFGSYGSFQTFDFISNPDKIIDLHLHLRVDQPAGVIVELLVSALTLGVLDKNYTWEQTEAISDFFMKFVLNSKEEYQGTIERLKYIDPQLLQESVSYLMELNAPLGTPLVYNAVTNRICLINKDITTKFSPYENRFLKTLINNSNNSVCFDALADEMYHSKADIKYSLWGITKTAQRVRDKLGKLGLPRDVICNIKGEGFMLRN